MTFNLALIAAVGASVAVACVVIAAAVHVDVDPLAPLTDPTGALVFLAVTACAGSTGLIEMRLLARGRYGWLIGRTGCAALLSVGLLAFASMGESPLRLFIASMGPIALAAPVTWYFTESRHTARFALRPLPPDARTIVRFAGFSFLGSMAGRLAWTGMPIVVALMVSPESNARFYVAWSAALVAYSVVQSISIALLAEGDRGTDLGQQTRHALRLGSALAIAVTVTLLIAAPVVRTLYGSDYAPAVQLLRILGLASLPLVIYAIASSVALVRKLERLMILLPLVLAAAMVPVAFATARFSITGAAVAWVVGSTVAGAAGLVVVRREATVPRTNADIGTPAGSPRDG